MGDRTGIQWTDATWNPLRGCSRVSEGCRHCYAETVAARFSGPGQPYEGLATRSPARWTGKVQLVEEHLADPLRWTRPRRIFVNSMSDLFHEAVSDETIDRVFAVMALATEHSFQVLTKRPERMQRYLTTKRECLGLAGDPVVETQKHVAWRAGHLVEDGDVACDAVSVGPWPLPNVWLGVSVEDQATADMRIPLLLQTPAAVRFVSYEPALGPVRFDRLTVRDEMEMDALRGSAWATVQHAALPPWATGQHVDWLIVGGESGPGARPFDVAWARSTIAQCKAAGVACFVKQLGARPRGGNAADGEWLRWRDLGATVAEDGAILLDDRKGGAMTEWPEDLRVREFPAAC